jgi:hypothetical protein
MRRKREGRGVRLRMVGRRKRREMLEAGLRL